MEDSDLVFLPIFLSNIPIHTIIAKYLRQPALQSRAYYVLSAQTTKKSCCIRSFALSSLWSLGLRWTFFLSTKSRAIYDRVRLQRGHMENGGHDYLVLFFILPSADEGCKISFEIELKIKLTV